MPVTTLPPGTTLDAAPAGGSATSQVTKLPADTKLDALSTAQSGFGRYLSESGEALGAGVRALPGISASVGKGVANIALPHAAQMNVSGPSIGDVATFATGGLMNPLAPEVRGAAVAGAAAPRELAAIRATEPAPPAVPPLSAQASKVIGKRLAEGTKSGGVTATDIMDQMTAAKREGQPLALVDVGGRPVQRLAGEVYRGPGGAAAHIRSFFQNRDIDLTPGLDTAAGARMSSLNQRYIASGSKLETADKLAQARSENAAPLWDKAMVKAPAWSPRMQQFLDHPDIQEGLRRGWVLERRHALAEGRPVNASDYAVVDFNAAGDPVFGKVPTMRMIQMAKEGIDDLLEAPGMRDTLPPFRLTKAGRSVDAVRRSFLDEGDKLNPDWKAAREQWAGDTQSMRALQDGRNLFDRSLTNEEIAKRWGDLSDNDKQFYLIGVADRLQQIMGDKALSADESKGLLNSSNNVKRMRMIFGDRQEDFDRYLEAVLRERTMFDTKHDIMGGSQTAEREAADTRAAAGLHAARGAAELATGHPLAAAGSALRAARDLGLRKNPELNAAIARMLTDPNLSIHSGPAGASVGPAAVNDMLRSMSRYPSGLR